MSGHDDRVQQAVRLAVRGLADEGRPVNLGERALRGVRRRRVRAVAAGALAVVVVVAAAALWPGFGRHTAIPPADPTPDGSAEPWLPFTGLGLVPSPPRGRAADLTPEGRARLVISAFLTPERQLRVLDPTTGAYPPAPASAFEAMSPDLRYAVISRGHVAVAETGEPYTTTEFGIYDTVASRVLGRMDLDIDGQLTAHGAAWSPDGTTVAVALRAGLPNGGGWLVRRLALVDVRTGYVESLAVEPAGGLEPQAMIGWANDRQRLLFEADPAGIDLIATGHLLVDPRTGGSTDVAWRTQGSLVPGVVTDEVAVFTADAGAVVVLNQITGQVLHEYPPAMQGLPYYPLLAWRDGELVAMADCDQPPACGSRSVLAIDPDTGTLRTLASPPGSASWVWVAPANGAVGPEFSW